MFCSPNDFVEFVSKCKYYVEKDIEEYADMTKEGFRCVDMFCPKGIIDHRIVWYFNHYKSACEAIKKWDERKKRINFDNIIVLMTLVEDADVELFNKIPLQKKLGIYYKRTEMDNILYLPEWEDINVRELVNKSWTGFANAFPTGTGRFLGAIDWIKFLYGDKDYKRFEYIS